MSAYFPVLSLEEIYAQGPFSNSTSTSTSLDFSSDIEASKEWFDYLITLQNQSAQKQWDAQMEADKAWMQFNHDEQELAYQRYQRDRSNAYQVAVADARKAGLNPLIALGEAATTSYGGAASGSSTARSAPNYSNENIVSSFRSLLRQLNQSSENAKTLADSSVYSSNVSAASNLFGHLIDNGFFKVAKNRAGFV